MNNNNTKKSLKSSVAVLFLCVVLLIGTTFAWFTDSVSSGTNVIEAGNLDISATVHDLAGWSSSSSVPDGDNIIAVGSDFMQTDSRMKLGFYSEGNTVKPFENNSDFMSDALFEPGKTHVKMIRITNNGDLAAKVRLHVDIQDGGLQDALWFALSCDSTAGGQSVNRAPMSTLSESLNFDITIKPDSQPYTDIIFAYGMNEDAGNEFKDKTFTAKMQILATQATHESDSFGTDYDAGATYPAANAAEFKDAVTNAEDGDTVALTGNIKLESALYINKDITIDGMGNAIISEQPVHVTSDNNVTFKDIQFTAPKNAKNNATSVYASKLKEKVVFDGCTFKDFQWEAIQITPVEGSEVVINNCHFENSKTMAQSGIETKRYVHIEGDSFNTKNVKVTLTNNTFKNVVQSAKGGNGYFSDSAVTICFIDDLSENLICSGNVFTGVVAEGALTDPYVIWITTSGNSNATSDYFKGFKIK